jgi:hypothetical protein
VPTALNHNTVTDVSAAITWTAGGTETQWQIAWKKTAISSWGNSAIATNNPPSHNLSGLEAATGYDVRVRAICAPGDTSNWTAIHSFTTLPAPSSCIAPVVSVSDIESTSASVEWTAGGTETQWVLEYGIGSSYDASIAVSTQPPYPLSDLQPNTNYSVRMRAVCGAADTSYYSNVATFTTPQIICNTPANLYYTAVDEHSISIAWTPVNGETKWEVSWSRPGSTGNVPVNGSPYYVLTDLISDTVYRICVKAICSDAVQSADTCIEVRTTSGINDIPLASGVKLYPNPASEQLTIDMESRFNTVEVTSTLGQVVYRANLTEKTKVIDVTGYSAGMYYVRLQGEAGTVTKKFVKR